MNRYELARVIANIHRAQGHIGYALMRAERGHSETLMLRMAQLELDAAADILALPGEPQETEQERLSARIRAARAIREGDGNV